MPLLKVSVQVVILKWGDKQQKNHEKNSKKNFQVVIWYS